MPRSTVGTAHPADLHHGGSRSPVSISEIFVFALILVFGTLAFVFHQRASDFFHDDVFYADAGRSLIEHGFYGINGRPETNQPPGLSAMLGVLSVTFGPGIQVHLRAMAVFEALGFLVTYVLFRRHLPKLVAAAICILLMSSPLYFRLATQWVFPCFPFFFTSMAALLTFEVYEGASTASLRAIWGFLLTFLIAASLMISSNAIALLGAMIVLIGVTFFEDRRLALTRLRRLLPVLLIGFLVQGFWMHRKPAPQDWSLPGYPGPYLQQLKLKSANYPELGMASPSDIPARIAGNLFVETDLFAQLTLRHGINQSRVSIAMIPVLLVIIGWACSLWQTEGKLLAWYFASYELVHLLWPWKFEVRFLLAIAPLACLYAWRGLTALYIAVTTKPRTAGIIGLPVCALIAVWAWHRAGGPSATHPTAGLREKLFVSIWLLLAVYAAWMAYTGRPLSLWVSSFGKESWFSRPLGSWQVSPLRLTQYAACGAVVILVAIGLAREIGVARENARFIDTTLAGNAGVLNTVSPEVEGALWIQSHTAVNSKIMARHVPIVNHYAKRSVVWFAPISNPDVLMQGIRRLNVDYVIVIKHKVQYYLPDDDDCFDRLLADHGNAFQIVFQDTNLRIFRVERNLALSRPGRLKQTLLVTQRVRLTSSSARLSICEPGNSA